MFWSSPAGSSVFLLLPACYSWSVHWMKADVDSSLKSPCWFYSMLSCDRKVINSPGVLWSTGWLDPAVWRDYEGKHQCEDCVWLLCLCQYLWLGLSHEEVSFLHLIILNHSNWWLNLSFLLCTHVTPCETVNAGVSSGSWTTWWPTKMSTWWRNSGMLLRCVWWGNVSRHNLKSNESHHTESLQSRDDGAAYPVLRPVCHAGGDGCLHCSEKGTWRNDLPRHALCITRPVSNSYFQTVSLCSGCFCSSIRCGTAPSSSSWPTLMPGCASAGQVQCGQILENTDL